MDSRIWYGCRQRGGPKPSDISIATWITLFSSYFIAGEFQFKIHWNFERSWPADTPNVEHKKLPRVVYRICQTHRETGGGKYKIIKKKRGGISPARHSHHPDKIPEHNRATGLIAFYSLQSHPHAHQPFQQYRPSFVASHQLKHYNVIIKMTNRITHDGKGSSRRS